MSDPTLKQQVTDAITSLVAHEGSVSEWVNGDTSASYTTTDNVEVPSIQKFIADSFNYAGEYTASTAYSLGQTFRGATSVNDEDTYRMFRVTTAFNSGSDALVSEGVDGKYEVLFDLSAVKDAMDSATASETAAEVSELAAAASETASKDSEDAAAISAAAALSMEPHRIVTPAINAAGVVNAYPGAKAAYSTRNLDGQFATTSVVNVRRASDNKQKDFTARDILDGAMLNWVNADVDTLPLDSSNDTGLPIGTQMSYFNGVDENTAVNLVNDIIDPSDSEFTLEFNFKSQDSGDDQILFSNNRQGGDALYIQTRSNGSIDIRFGTTEGSLVNGLSAQYKKDVAHKLTLSARLLNGVLEVSLFLDGEFIKTSTLDNDFDTTFAYLKGSAYWIGRFNSLSRYFKGLVYDVKSFDQYSEDGDTSNLEPRFHWLGYGDTPWKDLITGDVSTVITPETAINGPAAAAYSLRNLCAEPVEIVDSDTVDDLTEFTLEGLTGSAAVANGLVLKLLKYDSNGFPSYQTEDVFGDGTDQTVKVYRSSTNEGWVIWIGGIVQINSNQHLYRPWEINWAPYYSSATNLTFENRKTKGKFVTQVRRASDDKKRSFTANEVAGTELTDWVNATPALPLDTTTFDNLPKPSGAYSVHNLDPNYTGDVVTVRRSSDDAEADFNAVEVAGSTMVDWVNAVETIGAESDFSTATSPYDYYSNDGSTTSLNETIGGETGALKITSGTGGISHLRYLGSITNLAANTTIKLSVDVYVPSTNTSLDGIRASPPPTDFTVTAGQLENTIPTDTWTTVTVEGTSSNPSIHGNSWRLFPLNASENDVLYLKNYRITQAAGTGYVTKWYDQSGNNDATDATVELEDQQKVIDAGIPIDGLKKPAAAYSLRDLSSSRANLTSSGDTGGETTGTLVAQVRRSSDDEIKSFTAAEVAGGSLETWVTGAFSNATFANTDYETFSGASASGFTAGNTAGVGYAHSSLGRTFTAGETVRVEFDLTVTAGSSPYLVIRNSPIGTSVSNDISYTTSGSKSIDLTLTGNGTYLVFSEGDFPSEFTVANLTVSLVNASGYVSQWYDQSGNDNHAVQTTEASQPKIVDAGTLVADGIKLESGTSVLTANLGSFALNNMASFVLGSIDSGTIGALTGFNAGPLRLDNPYKYGDTIGYRYGSEVAGYEPLSLGTRLYTLTASSTQVEGFANGVSYDTSTVQNDTFTSLPLVIGSSGAGTLEGTVNEVIIYNSDQTDNRKAIESNMADYHNIDLPVGFDSGNNEVDGFVTKWYDQSGNNKHTYQNTETLQPKIVINGDINLNTLDNLPQIAFAGSKYLNFSGVSAFSKPVSIFARVDTSDSSIFGEPTNRSIKFGTSKVVNDSLQTNSHISSKSWSDGSLPDGTPAIFSHFHNGTTDAGNMTAWRNGVGAGSWSRSQLMSTTFTYLGRNSGSNTALSSHHGRDMQEIIIFFNDQTDNRTAIESNMAIAYDVDMADGYDPGDDKVDGFVTTWYDQSGYGNHATQDVATSQPKIVEEGNLITRNLITGGLDFDGSDDKLDFTGLAESDVSIFSVVHLDDVSSQKRILGASSINSDGFGIANATTGFFRANDGTASQPPLNTTLSTSNKFLYSGTRVSNTLTFFTDGVASNTATNSDTFNADSIGGGTLPIDGSVSEIIIYGSDQSDQRINIEDNIAVTHDITLARWTS